MECVNFVLQGHWHRYARRTMVNLSMQIMVQIVMIIITINGEENMAHA